MVRWVPGPGRRHGGGDEGSVVPLVAVVVLVVMLAGSTLVVSVRQYQRAATAQWAADAAALAAAARGPGPQGRAAAALLAEANGATVVSVSAVPPWPGLGPDVVSMVVVVEVEHQGVVAEAAAVRYISSSR